MNLRPLGYEPYDTRLYRLGLSPVAALTSAKRVPRVHAESRRLPCRAPIPPRLVHESVHKSGC